MVNRALSIQQAIHDGLFLNGLQFTRTWSCLAFESLLVEAARWKSVSLWHVLMSWINNAFQLGLAKRLT